MRKRLGLDVTGVVQGVGFRPFVYRVATDLGLTGFVRNGTAGVRIEVEGHPDAVERFLAVLRTTPPPAAYVERLQTTELPLKQDPDFTIVPSREDARIVPTLPPDLALCADCEAEVRDPEARRHGYAFTNCTACGPRYSIIERLPYDRPHTSMKSFPMCEACTGEYHEPRDRRFHAQPIACPACGPRLAFLDAGGRSLADGPDALERTVTALAAGSIVALKGLGGFQLLVDARDDAAVARLRTRKRRPKKPFAVLFPSLALARAHLEISGAEARALTSREAPILLLRKKETGSNGGVAESVAPGNPCLGVMLPYTPLHRVLADAFPHPVVCTSGNRSGEPMCIHTCEVIQRLGHVVDCVLTHDRPIVRPVDDSVAQFENDSQVLLRRARGYAPRTIPLPTPLPRILAVGGHLKNTVALGLGDQVLLSPHIGDLDGPEGLHVLDRTLRDLLAFLEFTPEAVACDLHPDYGSRPQAAAWAEQFGVPLVQVQHHHAHVASAVAEHGLAGPVLGLAWDGTGHGPDHTVWGGEALSCEGEKFTRVAHLRTFPLPGGERAVEEPRRAAFGLLHALDPDRAATEALRWFTPVERDVLARMIDRGLNAPLTSGMGRLFDAVAAILGLFSTRSFEGEAAMGVEFASNIETGKDPYPLPLLTGEPAVADWGPLVEAMLADRDQGVDPGRISGRFHRALAEHAVDVARHAALERVVLTGGCFQNRTLTRLVRGRLEEAGFRVYTHHKVPPNDGGLSLGQVWVAGHRLATDGTS